MATHTQRMSLRTPLLTCSHVGNAPGSCDLFWILCKYVCVNRRNQQVSED